MSLQDQAQNFLLNTWITVYPDIPSPDFILSLSNKDNTASIELDEYVFAKGNKQIIIKLIKSMTIPYHHWNNVSKELLQAQLMLEKSSHDLDGANILEDNRNCDIDEAQQKYANQQFRLSNKINFIDHEYELKWNIIDTQIARKLPGDAKVYEECIQINFDPNWIIRYFKLLIKESYTRIRPQSRIKPRVIGLNLRIRHLNLLIKGGTKAAENLRKKQKLLAQKRLDAFDPSTVQ